MKKIVDGDLLSCLIFGEILVESIFKTELSLLLNRYRCKHFTYRCKVENSILRDLGLAVLFQCVLYIQINNILIRCYYYGTGDSITVVGFEESLILVIRAHPGSFSIAELDLVQ